MYAEEDECAPLHYPLDNITRYVFEKLGERCAMPSIVLPTAVIYGLILLLGILGNLCTCMVVLRNRFLHNPTNFYLFSLAISDLLVLVLGLPMELYGVFDFVYPYKFGEFVCKGRAFLIEFTSYASILTITCFSVERWLAICFPLRIKLFSTLDRAVKVIIAVWFCAFLAASPVLSIVVVNKLPVPDWALGQPWLPLVSEDGQTLVGTDTCAMDFKRPLAQRNFIFSAFLLFFLLPAVLITLVYCHIVYRLCIAQCQNTLMLESAKQKMRSRKGVLKILVSVVVMFFLCWLPFHMQRLLSVYLNESADAAAAAGADDSEVYPESPIYTLFSVVFYISGYCYYSNSACNPILYNILSAKYRMAFCKTILGERLTFKLLHAKGAPHSRLQSKWSNCSVRGQSLAISPKMSSSLAVRCLPSPSLTQQRRRIVQLYGESSLLAAHAMAAAGVPLLLDEHGRVRALSLRRSQRVPKASIAVPDAERRWSGDTRRWRQSVGGRKRPEEAEERRKTLPGEYRGRGGGEEEDETDECNNNIMEGSRGDDEERRKMLPDRDGRGRSGKKDSSG